MLTRGLTMNELLKQPAGIFQEAKNLLKWL